MVAFFVGGSLHLKEDSLVYNVTDKDYTPPPLEQYTSDWEWSLETLTNTV